MPLIVRHLQELVILSNPPFGETPLLEQGSRRAVWTENVSEHSFYDAGITGHVVSDYRKCLTYE